jgi:hypothetical protein
MSKNLNDEELLEALKNSTKTLGQMMPVIVNEKGEVIDGKHRLQVDPNWRKAKVLCDDLTSRVVRLVMNNHRRIAAREDWDELARYLQETEGGEKSYLLRSNQTIAERISTLTGVPLDTVYKKLSPEFKQRQIKVVRSTTHDPRTLDHRLFQRQTSSNAGRFGTSVFPVD